MVVFAVLALAAGAGTFTYNSYLSDVETREVSSVPATIEIATGSYNAPTQFGLLPLWQEAYNGTGTTDYDIDDDGEQETEQCGNCHLVGPSAPSTKHDPPLHPLAVESMSGSSYTGEWFYDDDLHRGPNTQLADQESGILPGVQCGACHTPTDPASSFAKSSTPLSNDPHSVHRDVLTREGCIRCHVFNNRTFDRTGNGYGGIAFTQGNASSSSYGISNPINMTRGWDGVSLSTTGEANYSYDADNGGLNSSGTGWNVYGKAESSRATQYGCGDCHDQFHAEQGYLGTPLKFAFNDSAGSRKGPYAPVNGSESPGLDISGTTITCDECHVTDAHAVHTNGGMVTALPWSKVNSETDTSWQNTSSRGAEFCDECHSQNVIKATSGAFRHADVTKKLALEGVRDLAPDTDSDTQFSNADCGFCHV